MTPGALDRVTFPEFWRVWRDVLQAMEAPGTLFLVEGQRDRRSLEGLGITCPIALVHRGRRLADVATHIAEGTQEVVVLTDWDSTGGELAHRLRELLDDGRFRVNLDFRRRIGIALRGEIVHLEGLGTWARRRAEETGAPLEEWIADPDRLARG
jgi:5S rRNA maturation endonuclease (ribonuclease M5)